MPKARRRERLERADWIEAAVEALSEGGIAAVAIEPLAGRLGVTKGSFYHHFAGLDALLEALAAHWEEVGTEAVIRELDAIDDPRERLRRLVRVSWDAIAHLRAEAALAAATGDPRIGPTYARVTARRLAYLQRAYRDLGLPRKEARHRALHALAAYLGTLTLAHARAAGLRTDRELAAHARHLERALVPDRPPPARVTRSRRA